jgi:hypothetical protein
MISREEDWEAQRLWREDRDRRFAARVEEQRRLHTADPERHSLMIPVDDPEFPDESFTAGWAQEEGSRSGQKRARRAACLGRD